MILEEKLIAESIMKIVEYNAIRIFTSIKKHIKDINAKKSVEFNTAFSDYLLRAAEKYSRIKTLLYHNDPKYLYDFFEFMDIEKNYQSECFDQDFYFNIEEEDGSDDQEYESDNIIKTNDINNLLAIGHYIILTGTGGIGKTMMLKHFFLNAISNQQYIPLYIELREINNVDISLKECMYKSLANLGFNLDIEYLYYALECGCFIILLDGYDEILKQKHASLYEQINELCDQYPNNYYIISSRPSEEFVGWHRFNELNIRPLTKKQAISLVERIKYDPKTKEKFISSLDKNLYSSHKAFASNPLLLNIMLLTYSYYAEIPDKLHVFYDNAYETLFSRHDATKGVYIREKYCNLSSDDFKRVLSFFAFQLYIKRKFEFSRTDMILSAKNAIDKYNYNISPDGFIKDMMHSICILIKDGEVYKFIHRSFQEYFSALYIISCTDDLQRSILDLILRQTYNVIRVDMIFDILFDMCRVRFEKNFVIPKLSNIIKHVNSFDNKEFAFFCLMYEDICISDEEEIGFTVSNLNMFSLIKYLLQKYGYKYTSRTRNEKEENKQLSIFISKYGKINVKKIDESHPMYPIIRNIISKIAEPYYFLVNQLKIIKKQQRAAYTDIDKILNA